MNIENMTAIDWMIIIGLGITGGLISYLATSFINWLRGNYDKVEANDERTQNEPQDSKGNSDPIPEIVQSEHKSKKKMEREEICDEENKTVTVMINKIPYEARHTLCFDCEYCSGSVPYHKECSRSSQKIVWNPARNKGYCLDRVENED